MAKKRKWVVVKKIKDGVWEAKCTYPGCGWSQRYGAWHFAATFGYRHKH